MQAPTRPSRILLVDHDGAIRTLLTQYLEQHGYRTSVALNWQAMQRLLHETQVDLVILDVMMPGEDGLRLCGRLRAASEVPIIILTALGGEVDRIVGINSGADDYVVKPFNPRELLARIRAVLRRAALAPRDPPIPDVRGYRFGDWRLEVASRTLRHADGTEHILSGIEYRFLTVLLAHSSRVMSRAQLLELVRGHELDPLSRSIDVRISRLRHLLREDARSPMTIKTVYGKGYVVCVTVTQD